jgi:hypothetical protein
LGPTRPRSAHCPAISGNDAHLLYLIEYIVSISSAKPWWKQNGAGQAAGRDAQDWGRNVVGRHRPYAADAKSSALDLRALKASVAVSRHASSGHSNARLSLFPIGYIVPKASVKGCSMIDINVTSLITCQIAADGSSVRLVFEAKDGQAASLILPIHCIQQLLMTLPHAASKAIRARHGDDTLRLVFPLGDWKLERAAGASELILTLNTPDGFEVAFSMDHNAIAQMSRAAKLDAAAPSQNQAYLN